MPVFRRPRIKKKRKGRKKFVKGKADKRWTASRDRCPCLDLSPVLVKRGDSCKGKGNKANETHFYWSEQISGRVKRAI